MDVPPWIQTAPRTDPERTQQSWSFGAGETRPHRGGGGTWLDQPNVKSTKYTSTYVNKYRTPDPTALLVLIKQNGCGWGGGGGAPNSTNKLPTNDQQKRPERTKNVPKRGIWGAVWGVIGGESWRWHSTQLLALRDSRRPSWRPLLNGSG